MFRGFLRIKLSALVFTLWVIENQTSFLMAFRSENIFFLFGIFFSLIFYYFPTCQPSSSGQTELNISLFGSKKKIVKIVYLLSWNEISCEKNKNHFLNDLLIKEVKLQLKKLWMKRFHLPLWEFFQLQLCTINFFRCRIINSDQPRGPKKLLLETRTIFQLLSPMNAVE